MRNVKMRKTSNLRSFKLRKSSKGIQKSLHLWNNCYITNYLLFYHAFLSVQIDKTIYQPQYQDKSIRILTIKFESNFKS